MYVCTIIGLMVIGAMIASMIGITTPLRFGKAFVLQDVLDNIMPQLISFRADVFYVLVVAKESSKPVGCSLFVSLVVLLLSLCGIL